MNLPLLVSLTVGLLATATTRAQLNIPSDGSDGAFSPAGDVVIDLSQAVTGRWDADNSANAGKGIYDPEKWAIVFKYSSVNIPAKLSGTNLVGAKVTFLNHPSRAPVVWLVKGDVVIDGIVDLSGEGYRVGPAALIPSEPGPGGFRGGPTGPQGSGAGLGPGGGSDLPSVGLYDVAYGNPQVVPLIGGSGGAVGWGIAYGGAGGGALMIAASGGIRLDGGILAKGGNDSGGLTSATGSGGAVRLVAGSVAGLGWVNCLGGQRENRGEVPGNNGRIRLETHSLASSLRTFPETIAVPPAEPPVIWPPANAPKVRILSVDSLTAPVDPTAPLVSSADIGMQNDKPVVVLVETRDFPIEGVVQVRAAQKWGPAGWLTATYASGNHAQANWRLTNTFVKGYTTLQARATAP